MLQLGLADECCQATHIRLFMMQSSRCAYNASRILVSSIKGTFVEPKTQGRLCKSTMVNPFWLNGMEPIAFHQLNYLHHSEAQDQQ